MMTNKLPISIVAAMVGTVAILVLTVGVAVAWMTDAMDDQSRRHSGAGLRTALLDVLEQTRTLTLDYAKKTEAVAAVAAQDTSWLRNNFGSSAILGEVAQLAVVWGGPFAQDVGWINGQPSSQAGILDAQTLELANAGLAGVPLGSYRGISFFTWREGEVYALAAARVELLTDKVDPGAEDRDLGRIVMGQKLDTELLRRIGEGVLLDGVEIVRRRPSDRPSLPLMSGDARPVAYLVWDTHLDGRALLRRMLPALALVTAVATSLILITMMLVRRGVHRLVLAEQQSSNAARMDGLTGLPNRLAFNETLAAPARADERAILYLDLNGFKRINDSLGHAAGDLVIQRIAKRLAPLVQPDCFLARVGGDEFVFILLGSNAGFRAKWLAEAVERAIAAPLIIQGHQMQLRAALGYAVQLTDEVAGEDLVRQADLAMYEAKRHKAGPVAFGQMIGQEDYDARAIEQALRHMLADPGQCQKELSLAYQPIVDTHTGRLVRAEALARWTSPTLGPVPPDRFITVAERSGLIGELGQRILALIIDDLVAWPQLAVSLNVSPLQLMAPAFVPDLIAELQRRHIDPARIEVELTESMIVDDACLASARLKDLHRAGVSVALDDFGTGYSSIGYLRQMSFDTLKVDRSFVSGLSASGERVKLCNAMIQLGQALGLAIVCEGVETKEELDMVRDLGCGLAQGYFLDRPVTIERLIERWISSPRIRSAA